MKDKNNIAYRSFVLNQHGIQVNLALRGLGSVWFWDTAIFFFYHKSRLSFFCFKNIPTLHGTNAKAYLKSTETTFVLFLWFSLIICQAGMCGLNQRHRTKEQMTILFAVIDIKDLLWAFQAEHLHCCFHPSVDLYVHRSWDTGGRVCVNRRIKSKCYCSCRSAPLCIGQQIETMRWWEKDGVR